MSLLNKLMFWKKEDDFDFDKLADHEMGKADTGLHSDELGLGQQDLGLDNQAAFPDQTGIDPANVGSTAPGTANIPGMGSQPAGSLSQAQQPTVSSPLSATPGSNSRELELISSKLDTIKAILNSLDRRMANLEKLSLGGAEKKEEKLW
jgi:hypothetical protein